MKENKTIYIILGFLNHEDLTGYELKKKIDYSLSHFWMSSYGQIYPTLNQLAENGLVIRRNYNGGQNREKIVYSITDKGRKELENWVSQPIENEVVKYEILLKLFFGAVVAPDKNIRSIKSFEQRYQIKKQELEHYEKCLKQVLYQDENHLYYLLTVLFGQKVYKAYLEWAEQARGLIEEYYTKKEDTTKD